MALAFWAYDEEAYQQLIDPEAGSAWDAVYLGGDRLPGVATVEDVELERKLDLKSPKGKTGARSQHNGYQPGKFKIRLVLGTLAHWERYCDVAPIIMPRPGKPPSAPLTISHPAVNVYGIDQVLVSKVGGPKKGSVAGTMEVVIDCVQWMATPKNAGTMPKKADGNLPPTVLNEADAKYAAKYNKDNPGAGSGPPPPPPPSFTSTGPG